MSQPQYPPGPTPQYAPGPQPPMPPGPPQNPPGYMPPVPPPRVAWYHRKWFVVLMLILFFPVGLVLVWTSPQTKLVGRVIWSVAIALVVLVGRSSSNTPSEKSPAPSSSASQSAPSKTDSATKPAPADDFNFTLTMTDTGNVYQGKIVSDVSFAVIGAQQATTVGSQYFTEKASGGAMFMILKVYVKNGQKDAITLDGSLFKLLADGKEFSYSIKASSALELSQQSDSFFLKQMNPGITMQGLIPFEVPEGLDMSKAQLQVRGGMTGKTAKLPALPLLKK